MLRTKKFVCLFMAVLMLSVCHLNFAVTVNAETVSITEEKVTCTATLADDFADNRVLVVLTNEASLDFKTYTPSDFVGVGCKSVNDLTAPMTEKVKNALDAEKVAITKGVTANTYDSAIINNFNQVICLELDKASKENVLQTIKLLESRADVLCVEPDYKLTVCSAPPNDARYSEQWAATKIQLPQAREITTGSSTVLVGVVDTGINGNHPDLINRINPYLCRDFTSGTAVETGTPTDNNGHGTCMAGIIGAQGNNSIGITGVCQNVTLVSLKVLDSDAVGFASYGVNAIAYAEHVGIPILNLSLMVETSNATKITSIRTAIENYSGLIICAAGNTGTNNDENYYRFPANFVFPSLITVGASTESDVRRSKSNYGQYFVDLFAPGQDILTTSGSSGYAEIDGTSAATAFVTGVAALLLSEYPDMTACELQDTILSNVDDCGTAFDDECLTEGRLNAYNALTNPINHMILFERQGTASGHVYICDDCNYEFIEPHEYTVQEYSTTQHAFVCECGFTSYENHAWNSTRTKCLVCTYDITTPSPLG